MDAEDRSFLTSDLLFHLDPQRPQIGSRQIAGRLVARKLSRRSPDLPGVLNQD